MEVCSEVATELSCALAVYMRSTAFRVLAT